MPPSRYVSKQDVDLRLPIHAVWEVTLGCDLKCIHCGSRAGRKRPGELTTDEAVDVIDHLARLGTRTVTLIGGEAYLRRDWLDLVRAIAARGMECNLQTGGFGLTRGKVEAAARAGLSVLGVSIDGVGATHDLLRGRPNSFERARQALQMARDAGVAAHANTQINSRTVGELDAVLDVLAAEGVTQWMVQLTGPLGRAADSPELILQPWHLLEIMPMLDRLYDRALEHDVLLQIGNNIGYFGPFERKLRGFGDEEVRWRGCRAGVISIALEADGTVKGCPSLPTLSYAGGNVRDLPLDAIWATLRERSLPTPPLWGFCSGCRYRNHCAGGCRWTGETALGLPGNNPFCHHRALVLEKHGLREILVPAEQAPGLPFDHGRFEVFLETRSGERIPADYQAVQEDAIPTGAALRPCPGCGCHNDDGEEFCSFCGGVIEVLARREEERRDSIRSLVAEIASLLN